MSGSKTTYYVSSSTFPMFDDSSRVNQYAAAMLDYTANSPIEHSEYIKSFYNTSRLRNYRGYLNWCEKNGFYDIFGKVNADFYSDARLSLCLSFSAPCWQCNRPHKALHDYAQQEGSCLLPGQENSGREISPARFSRMKQENFQASASSPYQDDLWARQAEADQAHGKADVKEQVSSSALR